MNALKIAVLPDTQVKPGHSTEYLRHVGRYVYHKSPDVLVCLGDFADVPSLSSFDKGKKSFEGRRYQKDLAAAREGMDHLCGPIPTGTRKIMLLGNHEHRADRAVEVQPEFEGLLGTRDFRRIYEEYGWEVHDFLEAVNVNGVMFSHYFTSGVMGRPITTAAALLAKKHMSCIAGHQQGKQIAYAQRADGTTITGMIVGSCYEHNEDYLGPQGNKHWRGMVMLHEVHDGVFDEMFVSLSYLKKRHAATRRRSRTPKKAG